MTDVPTRAGRILWVLPGAPAQSGAGLRTQGLIAELSRQVEIVSIEPSDLFADSGDPDRERGSRPQRWRRRLSQLAAPRWAAPPGPEERARLAARLGDRIAQHAARAVVVSHATTATRLAGVRLDVPVIVDAYDLLWTQVRRRRAAAPAGRSVRRRLGDLRRSLVGRLREALAKRYELALLRQADAVWTCSPLDRERLESAGLGRPVTVVPNFVPGPVPSPDFDRIPAAAGESSDPRPPVLLFVGTMGYHANRSGMQWFAQVVWPRLRAARPDLVLRLVGRWPDWCAPSAALRQPGIEVAGFVPSLDIEWRQATLFVCPLRVGSGTRIKILEAWSRGVPVVSTPVGIEGLGARDGVEAAIAEHPEDFAARTLALLDDAAARARLASAGEAHWRATATPEVAGRAATSALAEVLSRGALLGR